MRARPLRLCKGRVFVLQERIVTLMHEIFSCNINIPYDQTLAAFLTKEQCQIDLTKIKKRKER